MGMPGMEAYRLIERPKPLKLYKEERSRVAVLADKVGYIPGVGTLVGIARAICGVVAHIFGKESGWGELVRGLHEIIPLLSWRTDVHHEEAEKTKEKDGKSFKILISDNYAHGTHRYTSNKTENVYYATIGSLAPYHKEEHSAHPGHPGLYLEVQ
jgi:hypothetical protein